METLVLGHTVEMWLLAGVSTIFKTIFLQMTTLDLQSCNAATTAPPPSNFVKIGSEKLCENRISERNRFYLCSHHFVSQCEIYAHGHVLPMWIMGSVEQT